MPLLINEIRQASKMGARGLDSVKELEFYLQAATDEKQDLQSNLDAIKILDMAYGLGGGITGDDGGGGNIPAAARARVVNAGGQVVTFANGTKWKFENGQVVEVQ